MTQELLDATLEREIRELRRRVERYRDGRRQSDVRGRTVIVVDDGLATGLTDLVAVRALRARGAARIVVAVPVGARESVALVGEEADEVVCHTIPRELLGVGRFYQDFSPVSDAEVVALLGAAARDRLPTPGQMPPPEPGHPPTPWLAERELLLDIGGVVLEGDLALPPHPCGLVIFAHGSGSSRLSPRNREVAATLNDAGLATLLFDLLTDDEGDRRELVFDIPLLARRLEGVTRWAIAEPDTCGLPIGYFAPPPARPRRCARPPPQGMSSRLSCRVVAGPTWRRTGFRTSLPRRCCWWVAATSGCWSSTAGRQRCSAVHTGSKWSRVPGTCLRSRGRSSGSRSWPRSGSGSI